MSFAKNNTSGIRYMHHLRNYKGFAKAQIELLRPFSLLIGPNGSGKSNVIEAVELLSFVARGQPLYEIGDVGRGNSGLEVRGGLQTCGWEGGDRFELGFSASIRFKGERRPFMYTVEICTRPYPQIVAEKLEVGDMILYETLPQQSNSTSRDLTVRYNNFARGGIKPQIQVSSDRSMLSQYREFAANISDKNCFQLVQNIMFHLQASFVFDPDPRLMRSYERLGDTVLKEEWVQLVGRFVWTRRGR